MNEKQFIIMSTMDWLSSEGQDEIGFVKAINDLLNDGYVITHTSSQRFDIDDYYHYVHLVKKEFFRSMFNISNDKNIHHINVTSGGWGEALLGSNPDCPIFDNLNIKTGIISGEHNPLFSNNPDEITCEVCKKGLE